LDLKSAATAAAGAAASAAVGTKVKKAVAGSAKPRGLTLQTGDLDVNIILPTLNEEEFVEKALQSLVKQPAYREGEVDKLIVLDSGSSDETVSICEKYADEVRQVPKGLLTARHIGTLETGSDIAVFTDADTIYPEGWLTELLAPFKDPEVAMTHGPKKVIDDELNLLGHVALKPLYHLYNVVGRRRQVSGSNYAVRRQAYKESGGFRLDINQQHRNQIFQESEFKWPDRVREVGEVKYCPHAVCFSSMRDVPIFTKKEFSRYNEEREAGVRF